MVKIEHYTSESVTEGHPDKVCDRISDAVLDELFKQDPMSRVAVETMTTTGLVVVVGEVTTKGYADIQKIVRGALCDIGYTDPEFGIDCEDAGVLVSIHGQSLDISQGVDDTGTHKQGAGDQGMMYGFACNETPELMPFPIIMAHKLTKKMAEVRKKEEIKHLGPDGKSQVSVEYHDGKPKKITAVVIAQQHKKDISEEDLKVDILEKVIRPICAKWIDKDTKIHINATGSFIIGGPEGDSGVTGRKIIVDTYGGIGRHGGGAFSGKDPSKVDRSGAYMARYVAKNIVAAGLADRCEIQLSYAIGVAEPTSINIDTSGTNKIPEEKIVKIVKNNFDMTPAGIIKTLRLRRPIYQKTSAYGHFGRDDPDFTWEKTDKAEVLKKEAGLSVSIPSQKSGNAKIYEPSFGDREDD
ncbi:MAG: methionine adenosyltransferase [Candidatus Woesearchaeota archaeon]